MGLLGNIIINLYSVILVTIIAYHNIKHNDKETTQSKIYSMMLSVTIILLVLDIFSRFDGKTETIFPFLNVLGNFLLFLFNPLLPSLWILYVCCIMFGDVRKLKRIICMLAVLYSVYLVSFLGSQLFGWYYRIDHDNIYHRGPLFLVPTFFVVVMILIAFVMILKNRNRIMKEYYFSLVFFAIPPLIGVLLQFFIYGIAFSINSIAISLLVVYLTVQNQNLYTDYMTGIYNRKKLDVYMDKMIDQCTMNKSFSAILIDIDDFKSINDTYGHDEGDIAIKTAAKLLQECVRTKDLLTRYGGDEFCIVLKVSNRMELETIVERIRAHLNEFNALKIKPYRIELSMGYAIYDYSSVSNAREFQKQIDELMYEQKFKMKAMKQTRG